MANRRMISKSISTSVKLARVSDFSALLFTWLVPHCDDVGNMHAEPFAVKGIVIPMRKKSDSQVEKAIQELQDEDLILLYEANGRKYLHIQGWEDHQTLRKDVTPDIRYPKHDGNATVTPRKREGNATLQIRDTSKEKRSKEKRREVKRSISGKPQKQNSVQDLVRYYFSLRGWNDKDPKLRKTFQRHLRPAKDVLEVCEIDVGSERAFEYAQDRVDRIKAWADSNEIDWTLETVIKKFPAIDQLQVKAKQPKYEGNPMYQRGGKWIVMCPNGEHKEFVGKPEDIVYE